MGRAYLEKYKLYFLKTENFARKKEVEERRKKQLEKYGFTEVETWSLDVTMMALLYERLRMYKKVTKDIIDLDYEKINVEGEVLTLNEILNEMIEICEECLGNEVSFIDEEYGKNCDRFWTLWRYSYRNFWW